MSIATKPWNCEPGELAWTDEVTGLECFVMRTPGLLHLCGYVGVPAGHPWHGLDYDSVEPYPEVHGGLTYAANHKPSAEPDGLWWLGFDCAHSGDLVPGMESWRDDVYRTLDYVRGECVSLAVAINEASEKS